MKSKDREYEDLTIDRVADTDTGHELHFSEGMGFHVDKGPIQPVAGMSCRLYGKGFGSVVRGVDIDGHEFYYRTPEQQEELHRQWVADREKQQQDEFEKNRTQMDSDFNALPPEFQQRLVRFRRNNPEFRWKHEPYELFCCKEALKIAKLGTREAVQVFSKASSEEQKRTVPSLDYDNHSGNTFGSAVRLAHWYVYKPENVVAEHGALCPLTGCRSYGCVPEGATEYTA